MSRNPRRAYNPDGSMIQPATVGSERAMGMRMAELWCEKCVRCVEISTDGLPDDLPVPDICLSYRCSICGGKNLSSRSSVAEHYRLVDAAKGRWRGSSGNRAARPQVLPDDREADMKITSAEQARQAEERIAELAGAAEDTPEEQELIALVEALETWRAQRAVV